MPKLEFKATDIESTRKVVDEGLYWITCMGFNSKVSSKGDSINYNPTLELTALADGSPAPTKDDGRPIPVFFNGNSKFKRHLNDFVHGFGLEMEDAGNGNIRIPGAWLPEEEPDIAKCTYKGPMVGRKAKVFLTKDTYNGQPQNKIKYFVCAVPNCHQKFPNIKHSDNLK